MKKNNILFLMLMSLPIFCNDLTTEQVTQQIEAQALKKREEKFEKFEFIAKVLALAEPIQETKRFKAEATKTTQSLKKPYKKSFIAQRSGSIRSSSDELLRKVLMKNAEKYGSIEEEKEKQEKEKEEKEKVKAILFNRFKELENSLIEETLEILYPTDTKKKIEDMTLNLKKFIDKNFAQINERPRISKLILQITIKELEINSIESGINPKIIADILKEIESK